jgi:DNA-binding NtrC family response regulator
MSRDGGSILVVEDRASLRRMLERALTGEGHRVTTAADGEAGIARLANGGPFDLVLTDLKLPGATGLDVLAAARRTDPRLPVVVMTAFGTVATAVEAMKLGALDFLEKPVEIDELFALVEGVLAGGAGPEEAPVCLEVPGTPPVVGRHPRLRVAARLLTKVAPRESTVLLLGESGTGKELFARALHGLSGRRDGPFVAVNCAAIPEALLENELFGHEKGAFTGAVRRAAGRFERAAGGTLFLDEVGDLPLAVQGKILRVLEERVFERVGGEASLDADVRLVAATNRDLEAMVGAGAFRSDLYYRLAVFVVELPSLAERPGDVPLLARHLAERLAGRHGLEPPELSEDALELLAGRSWPGNVRELSNALERALILAEGSRLTAADLEAVLGPAPVEEGVEGEETEAHRLRRVLTDTGGDKQEAARRLGMSYRTLQRRVRRWDLEGVGKYR